MTEKARKVDKTIKVCDKVRSFDFDYVDDCYVEGIVKAIVNGDGCDRYEIPMTKKVFGGKDNTAAHVETHGNLTIFYPPVNGLETWMGSLTCGVQKI